MAYLLTASLIWAFSFGLIKHVLSGLDPFFIAFIRLALSLVLFLPFLRVRRTGWGTAARLLAVGAVQYGMMYMAYIFSFRTLAAHEVALFTVFTPICVTVINDIRVRRFHGRWLLASMLAVAGAGVIVGAGRRVGGAWTGFLVLQFANLCFAGGQVWYRGIMRGRSGLRDAEVFAWLFAGAAAVSGLGMAWLGRWEGGAVTLPQALTLGYLGLIPSGVGFFLWNAGARRAKAGSLAVLNNLKIPLAVLVSIGVFGERPDWWPFLLGAGAILAAAFTAERAGEATD
ncbi:MAG: EamA family transporter [Lentisphaerae bacterium]|nr:EamA family transporter [Lentisphaerota bacterium]